MSKIARIELFHVAVPLPATFYPSWIPGFPQTENRFTLIKVTTDDGAEGYSAGPALARERAGLGELLGPYLLGEDACDIALIQQRLREISYLGWRNFWIEPAFWDVKGKLAGEPVYRLLGGTGSTIELYASCGDLKAPAKRIEEAEARYAEGFRAVKLRVHDFDEAADERQVMEVARHLGERMRIGVDANQGWRVTAVSDAPLWDLERAKRFADVCADAGVAWLEEPLPMDAYDELSELTAYSRVPIAGGELHTSGWPELAMMIRRRCYDIFQPDALFAGGIAQTSGFQAERELEYPLSPPGWTVEARDALLETPFQHERGKIRTPELPGLGFKIDRRQLRKYARRFFVMDRKRLIWFSLRTRGLKVSQEIDRARRQRWADA